MPAEQPMPPSTTEAKDVFSDKMDDEDTGVGKDLGKLYVCARNQMLYVKCLIFQYIIYFTFAKWQNTNIF